MPYQPISLQFSLFICTQNQTPDLLFSVYFLEMLAMEEVLCELIREDRNEQGLPPGFRFHPTDEELITFYLASKVFNGSFCGVEIAEIDLNRYEPWELPAKMGEREWYFFSLRDRKYPTGLRTNRATGAGYWKATGKDREVYSASSGGLLGMKKTLVFYMGRAPRGEKTKWVMHEYRLDGDFSYRHTCKEEWVICRIFHKNVEKKNGVLQGQSLPSLLECQSQAASSEAMQHPFMIRHQENDLKSLLQSPLVSQSHQVLSINGLQPCFSPTPTNGPSTLFESLISHQEQSCIQTKCKTEESFSHFQLPDASNLSWVDKILPNPYQLYPPFSFDIDCNVMGASAASTDSDIFTAHEMSTSSVAFNSAAFHTMFDTSIRLPAESWALDPSTL